MKLKQPTIIPTDVLVIGSGGAGLRAAIEARKTNANVLLVSKSRAAYGNNTAISGAALAIATGWREPKDNPNVHLKDTIVAGRFVNNQKLVDVMVQEGSKQIADLETFGVKFAKREGKIWITSAAGHTYPRHVFSEGRIGTDLTRALLNYAITTGVKVKEKLTIIKLLKRETSIVGAIGIDKKGEVYVFTSKATVLASGGLGHIFRRTTNAPGTIGDGYALAYKAGLPLLDMEFIQFYPTAMGERGQDGIPYEVFVGRGGGVLKNSLGEDILAKWHINETSMMTRDRVTQAIMKEILQHNDIDGKVTMDLSMLSDDRFSKLSVMLPKSTRVGQKVFDVAPSAHHCMGGVKIDENCRTEVDGLFAAGEICGGIHGANRLAGNALIDILVFGTIAGKSAAEKSLSTQAWPIDDRMLTTTMTMLSELASYNKGTVSLKELRETLEQTMWYHGGIIRNQSSLKEVLTKIRSVTQILPEVMVNEREDLLAVIEFNHMLTVSEMVCRAALERTESRGAHFRDDYPEEDDSRWLKNILISQKDGQMVLSKQVADMPLYRILDVRAEGSAS